MSDPTPSARVRRWLRGAIAAVAIVIVVLVLRRLGRADVCSDAEAVTGMLVQQVVEHGQTWFPIANGSIPLATPPLFHWTALVIDRALRIAHVTAANLRLPSAIYAIATAILTMLFAASAIGLGAGVLAGLTLAGSYQFISLGRVGSVDMALTFFEALALFAFFWWMRARDRHGTLPGEAGRGFLYLLAIALGLAVLAAGPIGALLPGAAIIIFMITEGRARQILAMLDPGVIVVGLAIASSWYLACYFSGRFALLVHQLEVENVGRFVGVMGSMPPWFYVAPILLNSVPFSLFVPIAVVRALRSRQRGDGPEIAVEEIDEHRAGECVRLCAIFWIVTVLFFSLAVYKSNDYLLPLWPVSAVMLAWWLVTIPPIHLRRAAATAYTGIGTAMIVFNLAYIPHSESAVCGGDSYRPVAEEVARVVEPDAPIYLFGFTDEPEPLVFYLDRGVHLLDGRLGDAPPGYVLVPENIWQQNQQTALDLEPVLTSEHGSHRLVLLRHGKSYASRYYFRRASAR
jgi:4-amino-4-deoxy-L-arabinose transferase-like glycosyltransferase